MTILVDTNILIELFRNRQSAIFTQWRDHLLAGDAVLYSAITGIEIRHGLRPSEVAGVEQILAHMSCLPVTCEIAAQAGRYLNIYHRSHGLELADSAIAATATMHGLWLWTLNRKHYPMPELQLL